MTMKKNINSGQPVVVSSGKQSDMFPVGYSFIMHGVKYIVTERMYESNTELRKMAADNGDIEVVTVDTLLKDHSPIRNPGGIIVVSTGIEEKPESEEK